MRQLNQFVLIPGGRRCVAAAAAAVFLLLSIPPVHAQVPVVQGGVGAEGAVAVFQPFEPGFTEVSAASSNSDVVQISKVEKPRPGGVNFAVQGEGLGIVTITWRNPMTGEERQGYFVVASGVIVDRTDTMTLTKGQTMLVAPASTVGVPVGAVAYAGNTLLASTAVVVPQVRSRAGVQITAQGVGTGFVTIELPRDASGTPHFQVLVVTVIGSSQPPTF